MSGSWIESVGSFVPEQILDNDECAALAGVSAEWIIRRTGIQSRRVAAPGVGTAVMASSAARQALARSSVKVHELELVVVATSTPDHLTPPTASEVQAELGALNAACFDVEAGFSAWLFALIVADSLIQSGVAANALVIGADKMSSITDRSDPDTGPLFGDGAGAVVLRKDFGLAQIRSTSWWSDGRLSDALVRLGGGAKRPFDAEMLEDRSHLLRMEGTRLFKHAVRTMSAQAEIALERAGISVSDVALFVPHQANLRILQTFARTANVNFDRVYVNIDRYGNTGAATIPIALAEAVADSRVEGFVLLVGFGAGATAGAVVLETG
jgi:3-oxoacyl-[acyl-carrier-protein] synthase III